MSTSRVRGHAASFHQYALLDAAKRGDRRAQEELLRRYEPLIGAIVAGLRLPCGCERGDIAQEARIGLVRAIRAWRPERGPFRAFASRCARAQAIKAIDTAGTRKHQLLSRAASLHSTPSRSVSPSDVGETADQSPLHERLTETRPLADPVRTVLAREQLDEIRCALATLTGKERAALTGHLKGVCQRQLASELGWTEKAVHRSLRRARDKLGTREERLAV
ncbi:MAG TPA: sigma-70 family RNA polymerase sigma factor [Solirubrobacteraceae bacterium]|nr:sigma-70 family RNA polymerase sigma factor [Solirubrobacteraceae bacterium]